MQVKCSLATGLACSMLESWKSCIDSACLHLCLQVSVLAMTSSPEGSRDTLKYKLQGVPGDVSKWGHEYIRHLAGERRVAGGLVQIASCAAALTLDCCCCKHSWHTT
jgi:hypothetical protein